MHLDEIDSNIQTESLVYEGQLIGTMGRSGNGQQEYSEYGSHLHYEIRINGEIINPVKDANSLIDQQTFLNPIDGGTLDEIIVVGEKREKPRVKFIDMITIKY